VAGQNHRDARTRGGEVEEVPGYLMLVDEARCVQAELAAEAEGTSGMPLRRSARTSGRAGAS
jgi:hypothetical protein